MYLGGVILLTFVSLAFQFHPSFLTSHWAGKRLLLFSSLVAYGVGPSLHWVLLLGGWSDYSVRVGATCNVFVRTGAEHCTSNATMYFKTRSPGSTPVKGHYVVFWNRRPNFQKCFFPDSYKWVLRNCIREILLGWVTMYVQWSCIPF